MKILLTLFVLLFSSSVVADDISDFEIEGFSIGDSLLEHFSEKEIKLMLKTKIQQLSTTLQKSNRCILEKIMISLYYICTGRRIANIQQYYLTQLTLNSSAKNPILHSMDLARLFLQQKDPNPSDKSVIQSLLNKGPTL